MLTRPFVTLAVAIFTATLGIGMVAPILPVYARSLGASGTAVGLTFSAFALTQIFISPFTGRLADRYGRKWFIVAGLVSYVVAAVGWWLMEDVLSVILFRALTGVGSALVFSLALSYIGDLAPAGREGRFMGTFGIFDFLGFGSGPLIAGVLVDHAGLDAAFVVMAVLYAIATAIVAALLPRRPVRAHGPAHPSAPSAAPWREILAHPYVQALYALRVSFALSMGASFSFFAIYLEEDLGTTATMVGAVLAAQQVSGGLLQPLLGALADRAGRRRLVVAGALLVAAGNASVWATDIYPLIVAGFVLGVGVGGALVNVSSQAIQVELGRRLGMATIMSLQSMGFAVGVLVGSLGGGVIVELVDVRTVFLVSGLAVVAGAAFFVLRTGGPRASTADTPARALEDAASG